MKTFSVTMAAAMTLAATAAQAGDVRGQVPGATADKPAVVWIDGLKGAAPKRDTVITHKAGHFEPFVSIGYVGNDFVLRNDDDTLHNTHLYLRLAYQKERSGRPLQYGATLYNVALPKAGAEVKKPITEYQRYRDETGYIEVVCNPHPGEHAYVLVFDHPYAAVTGPDGSFTIPDVPPGKHELRVWHDGGVDTPRTVDVQNGKPTDVVIGSR